MGFTIRSLVSVVKDPPANAGDMGFLIQEDATCRGATKPVCPTSEPESFNC